MYEDHSASDRKLSTVEPGNVPVKNKHSSGGAVPSIAAPRRMRLLLAFRPNAEGLSGKRPKPASLRPVCEFGTNDKGGRAFNSEDGLTVVHGLTISSLEDISSLWGDRG